MKLKLNRRQLVIGAVIVLVVIAALFASRANKAAETSAGVLDDAARTACTDFAGAYRDAKTKTARLALADKVMESTVKTDNDVIADRAAEMGRTANDTTSEWKSSAANLMNACENAGWKA
ncbi:hypothetical protein [Actinoplanes sp. TFC3]|uniref:hypothetical protein n=1 Tax=Actinoplanes sp. TFC3 TaxID=1710355 RepID=UPI00082F0BA5|nr:hypothetical protein [Actinoplanes sp. TFC3]